MLDMDIEDTARTGATVGGEDTGSDRECRDQVPFTGDLHLPSRSFYLSCTYNQYNVVVYKIIIIC